MKPILAAIVLAALLLPAGCQHEPLSTAGIEERYLGWGYARELFRQGEQLQNQGRYREALTAFTAAESSAYTEQVRTTARERRHWLESYIKAMEEGRTPPPRPEHRQPGPKTASHTPPESVKSLTPDSMVSPRPDSGEPAIQDTPLPPGPKE